MSEPGRKPILLRALKRLSHSRFEVCLATVLLVATTLCALSGPWILRYAVDHGLRVGQPDLRVIGVASLVFLGLALSALVMSRRHTRLTGTVGERFVRDLRQDVLVENLAGAKVVQAFGQEQPRIARFLRENDAQLNANLFCIARRTNRSARGDSAARVAADPDSALGKLRLCPSAFTGSVERCARARAW